MRRSRALWLLVAAVFGVGGLVLHGQFDNSRLVILNIGLPAVDQDTIPDMTHRPGSPEAIRRASLRPLTNLTRVSRSGREYVAGRVLVRFRDEVPDSTRDTIVRDVVANASGRTRPDYADFDLVSVDTSADAEAIAGGFRTRSEVEYAQPAYRVRTTFVPNDPHYSDLQWNLPLIQMESAWDIQPQAGSSITVAIVDTGLAFHNATLDVNVRAFVDETGTAHPALGHQLIPYSAADQIVGGGRSNRIVAPRDFIWNTNDPLDFDGHGTHVAGTIGQITNDGVGTAGVAFNVKLMPIKVLASDWDVAFGGAPFVGGSEDQVAQGIRYAADNGANVINMSLGHEGPANCGTNSRQDGCSPTIEAAMRYAVGKGSFVVVSAGNFGEEVDPEFGTNPTSVIAEIASRIQGAVSVAAVDRHAVGQTGSRRCTGTPALPDCHAYYSSFGPYVELSAPGGSERGFGRDGFVWQQTFDYNFTDTFLLAPSQYKPPRFDVMAYVGYIGTSMAAPHVSGVAAMLMQQGIKDPAAIEAALEKFAVDLGDAGRDDKFGFGLVDARASLRGLGLAR